MFNKLNCPRGLVPGKPQEPEKDKHKALGSLNTGSLGDTAEQQLGEETKVVTDDGGREV